MQARCAASRVLFALGLLALAGAVALLLASSLLPSEGFQDLGRFLGALLLVGLASIPFALSLVVAPDAPRWLVAFAGAGCLLALLPGIALLTVGVAHSMLLGAVFLVAALGGLMFAWRRGREPATRIA